MIFPLLLAAALALVAPHSAQQPSPEPSATPTIAVTPAPAPSASASPVPSPAPSATPTGLNLPPLKYHIAPRPSPSAAPDAPEILALDLVDQTVFSGKVLAIRVTTNDVVTKVTISSNGRSGQMTQIAPGRFESSGIIPKLPPLVSGLNVNLVFTATTADGRSTSAKVPLRVRR